MPRRLILACLVAAGLATGVFLGVAGSGPLAFLSGVKVGGSQFVGSAAPPVAGTTLDGSTFDLTALAGKPVVVNFWGPSCVPCRDEFPLLEANLAQHGGDGLAIVGVLTDDPVEPARDFVSEYKATWATVIDPDKSIKASYRVAARPQTYFIDRAGVVRSIQIGELTDVDFERQYARIAQ
jgi:cytochrome c biogenesis protein CcmG/thiol:disulfide interchange protein DsbE